MNSNIDIQKALEPVILYRIDAEKGAGKDLAKEFKVNAYPSFYLVNKGNETLALWRGYEKNDFIKMLSNSLVDLSTIAEKKTRYDTLPDVASAVVLGRYSSEMGEFKEAVKYYSTANVLSSVANEYSYDIFKNTADGVRDSAFTYDDAAKAANAVLNQPKKDIGDIIQVCNMMMGMAKSNAKPADVAKYIQAGLDATATSDDPDIKKTHSELMVDFSLSVKHDTATAIEYKKAAMPENWQKDAGNLNEFAWWCFENKANLTEAEQLSRQSIELAKPGRGKADCYDTLAEILFAKGNAREALEMSKKSVSEAPDNKYFPTQVERFEKGVGQK